MFKHWLWYKDRHIDTWRSHRRITIDINLDTNVLQVITEVLRMDLVDW